MGRTWRHRRLWTRSGGGFDPLALHFADTLRLPQIGAGIHLGGHLIDRMGKPIHEVYTGWLGEWERQVFRPNAYA